ncbi:L-threonylcarbamoyladenylate synthase [Yoonia sp. F2084L]|uniref:L-threonylcarbamoyladenylate synthase n=1 Tax=Yoonia sp. F2084L TaxID=2926419 RepID=UPI001FF6220A|nr:L-threonylcarbamoyladenylate synthase [Yoonia sp. F2084L]MCK0096023.1 L-threonylcarbamoyladenylate synthase [Yoonia sp. F2084L]
MKNEQLLMLKPDLAGLEKAAVILQGGGLVSFPTETVYGLGADARNDRAVARIYEAKGRPSFNPLIVHVADADAAARYCEFNDIAQRLAQAFWPGALTLVLPLKADAGISKLVTAGLDTLAIRVPDHPVAAGLLGAFGGPVAAPSANPSGKVSPTTAAHVADGLGDKIDAVVNGGHCAVGVESTIVSCVGDPALLRAGGIPAEALEACLGRALVVGQDPELPTAPGQLESHYAPRGKVRLNAPYAQEGEVLLGFGPVDADLNLSVAGDLTEAAAHLFAYLHQLDAMGAKKIAVSPIPDHGLGRAINDRLKRAAAPR